LEKVSDSRVLLNYPVPFPTLQKAQKTISELFGNPILGNDGLFTLTHLLGLYFDIVSQTDIFTFK